jgi:hypothetical protein
VATLDKSDAELFRNFCTFSWHIGIPCPLITNRDDEIYKSKGITFDTLSHLQDIGLIVFETLGEFARFGFPRSVTVAYFDHIINVELPDEQNNFPTGQASFTRAGQQLCGICGSTKSDEFMLYALNYWISKGFVFFTPITAKRAGSG